MSLPQVTVLGHERPELVKPVHLLERGELYQPREQVDPGLPATLAEATGRSKDVSGPFGSRKELALWSLNSVSVNQQAWHLASRVVSDAGTDQNARIDRLWQIVLARPASESEKREAAQYLADSMKAGQAETEDPQDESALEEVPPTAGAATFRGRSARKALSGRLQYERVFVYRLKRMRDARCGMRDAGCEMRDARCWMLDRPMTND